MGSSRRELEGNCEFILEELKNSIRGSRLVKYSYAV